MPIMFEQLSLKGNLLLLVAVRCRGRPLRKHDLPISDFQDTFFAHKEMSTFKKGLFCVAIIDCSHVWISRSKKGAIEITNSQSRAF